MYVHHSQQFYILALIKNEKINSCIIASFHGILSGTNWKVLNLGYIIR
jgi:hypothetical protein